MASIMRFQCIFIACLDLECVLAIPWPSRVRLPPQIHDAVARLPVTQVNAPEGVPAIHQGIPGFPFRKQFSDHVHDAVKCCHALTAECLACATHQDLDSFCADEGNMRILGCQGVLEKATETSQERAFAGMVSKIAEKAVPLVGDGGAHAEERTDDFLERHPDVAQTSIRDLTSDTFDTISSLKSLFLEELNDMNVAKKQRPYAGRAEFASPEEMLKIRDEYASAYSFANPWVLAVCALLATAVSSGIAVGALCHARTQGRAREPLLSTLLQDVGPQPAEQA